MGLVPREPIIFLYLSGPVGEGLRDAVGGNFLTQGCSEWESLCTSWPALGQYTKTRGGTTLLCGQSSEPGHFRARNLEFQAQQQPGEAPEILRTPSKGSRFANQSCGNSGHPDYFRGLLWNTQQVWPPRAPRGSAAPQPRQKQLVAQARVGLLTLLGPPRLAGDPVSAGPRRFRGSPQPGSVSRRRLTCLAAPRSRNQQKRGQSRRRGAPRAERWQERRGAAGLAVERRENLAEPGVTPRASAGAGTRAPTRSITPARTHAQSHTSLPHPPARLIPLRTQHGKDEILGSVNLQRSLVVVFPLVVPGEFLDEFVQFLHPSSRPEIQLREGRLVVAAQGGCLAGGGSRHLHAKRAERRLGGGRGTHPRPPPRPGLPARLGSPARGREGWLLGGPRVALRSGRPRSFAGGAPTAARCACGPGTRSPVPARCAAAGPLPSPSRAGGGGGGGYVQRAEPSLPQGKESEVETM